MKTTGVEPLLQLREHQGGVQEPEAVSSFSFNTSEVPRARRRRAAVLGRRLAEIASKWLFGA